MYALSTTSHEALRAEIDDALRELSGIPELDKVKPTRRGVL
jgi:hypothetical protein